jgi:hypothetical protein
MCIYFFHYNLRFGLNLFFVSESENASLFMKPFFFVQWFFLLAQHGQEPNQSLKLCCISGASFVPSTLRMPCGPANGLSTTICEEKTPTTRDNFLKNGVFMT